MEQLKEKLIINNNKKLDLEDFIYLTKKIIKSDNNSSMLQLQYKFNLQDKYKFKYGLTTNELFYNIGMCSLYLQDKDYKINKYKK